METDVSVTCEMIPSKTKPGYQVCKVCNQVMKNEEFEKNPSPFCFQKLQTYALREDVPSVRLKSVEVVKDQQNVPQKPTEEVNNFALNNNWWNMPGTEINKNYSREKPLPPPIQGDSSGYKEEAKKETIEKRMKICETCEFYKDNLCLKCGCALSREHNYKNKLFHEDAKCPIDKW